MSTRGKPFTASDVELRRVVKPEQLERLNKLIRALRTEKRADKGRFNMACWFDASRAARDPSEIAADLVASRKPSCGTSGCIGGWAEILFGSNHAVRRFAYGISPRLRVQAKLFGVSWFTWRHVCLEWDDAESLDEAIDKLVIIRTALKTKLA